VFPWHGSEGRQCVRAVWRHPRNIAKRSIALKLCIAGKSGEAVSAGRGCASFIAALAAGHLAVVAAQASPACPEEQASPQEPTNLELCRRLEPIVRHPGDHP